MKTPSELSEALVLCQRYTDFLDDDTVVHMRGMLFLRGPIILGVSNLRAMATDVSSTYKGLNVGDAMTVEAFVYQVLRTRVGRSGSERPPGVCEDLIVRV